MEALEEVKDKKKALVTHVIFALDTSGSMGYIRDEAIELFNSQVAAIKADPSEKTTFSYGTFGTNSRPEIHYLGESLDKLEKLTVDTYKPDGGTPLNDCLGKICERVEAELVNFDEDYAVLVVIVSDGQENHSGKWQREQKVPYEEWKHYTDADIKELVTRLEKTERWTFTYLGANQKVRDVSAKYGINVQNVQIFHANKIGTDQAKHDHVGATHGFMAMRNAGGTQSKSFYAASLHKVEDEEDKAFVAAQGNLPGTEES